MEKVTPKTLPGFLELLPKEQILFNELMDKIRHSYEKFGFLPLDTPILELSEVLLAKAGGETEKQIYRFTKGENDLSLRFDLTVPLAKYVAEYYHDLSFPFRRYQIGKVYRGEKPQKGRFREFYQCDIDVINENELSIATDAEMPSIIYYTFRELGFGDFTIFINNRKILNGLFASLSLDKEATKILRVIDKIDKIGEQTVKKELLTLNIPENKVDKILEFIQIQGTTEEKIEKLKQLNIQNEMFQKGLEELVEVVKYIPLYGVPKENFKIDLKIARGLDYYTGTVYETFLNNYRELGSICSGGRYENLADYYTDKKLCGVGISIGLSRLFYKLNEMGLIEAKKKTTAEVLILPMDDKLDYSLEVGTKLREKGINTEVYLENKKIKAKMKYADRLGIKYTIVIGEEERQEEKVTLKNMETGEQEKLTIEQAIEKIK